jgi:hypothetical protein
LTSKSDSLGKTSIQFIPLQLSKISIRSNPCDSLSHQIARTLPLITHYKAEGHFLTLFIHDTLAFKAIAADWD